MRNQTAKHEDVYQRIESNRQNGFAEVRAYKLIELAAIYQVHRETCRSWISDFTMDIGPRKGHYYTVKQVQVIFTKLGLPPDVNFFK